MAKKLIRAVVGVVFIAAAAVGAVATAADPGLGVASQEVVAKAADPGRIIGTGAERDPSWESVRT